MHTEYVESNNVASEYENFQTNKQKKKNHRYLISENGNGKLIWRTCQIGPSKLGCVPNRCNSPS